MPDPRRSLAVCLLIAWVCSACTPELLAGSSLELATHTENAVQVDIRLEMDGSGQAWIAATFTPQDENTHLYSKDLPPDGVDGLGRPTLLELVPGSGIQEAGDLSESVPAVVQDVESLSLYPAGPVILRLPVTLPSGSGWHDENVSVSYMACSDGSCYPPVTDRIIPIRIPGAEENQTP